MGVAAHHAIAHLSAVAHSHVHFTIFVAVPSGIGAVATILAPNRLALRCFSVISPSHARVTASPRACEPAPNFSPALRHFCANSSAHNASAHPAISGVVTYF